MLRGRRRLIGCIVAVIIAIAVAVAWWFPARWAWFMVRDNHPRIHLAEIGGSIWNGHAGRVSAGGIPLGSVSWTASRYGIIGTPQATVHLQGQGFTAHGTLRRLRQDVFVAKDVQFRMEPAAVAKTLGLPHLLAGSVSGKITTLRIETGWPTLLDADVTWSPAILDMGPKPLALGDFRSRWQMTSPTDLTMTVKDLGGGPLTLDGAMVLHVPDWQVDATVRVAEGHPRLTGLLGQLVRPDDNGRYVIHRRGNVLQILHLIDVLRAG